MRRLAPSLLALAAAVVFLAVALAVHSSGSSGSDRPAATTTTTDGTHHHAGRLPSSIVRNARPQPDWRPYTAPVPILVYHDLGSPPPTEAYPGLFVSDSNFQSEMAWLHASGHQAVTLDEVMSAWYHGGRLPPKPIVITFDNGYIPQATFAPSVMSRYGWPGVLNEITAGHLDDARIRHLLSLGWEVDSHSVTHPDMTAIPASAVKYQLVASRRFLQRTFHIPANSFCYPSNRYNASVIAAVKAAGYTNATTENSGYATRADPYQLNRFEIEGGVGQLQSDLAQGP
jgi:peptidoglycan/xylan/chitin deacetylase (PgdA/CDA1 family)